MCIVVYTICILSFTDTLYFPKYFMILTALSGQYVWMDTRSFLSENVPNFPYFFFPTEELTFNVEAKTH